MVSSAVLPSTGTAEGLVILAVGLEERLLKTPSLFVPPPMRPASGMTAWRPVPVSVLQVRVSQFPLEL
jgi:hypothetical protein